MPSYKKAQFISWEIHTGPLRNNKREAISYAGFRNSGLPDDRVDAASQCFDIDARLAFTSNAMNTAHKLADANPATLKVFLAPEFLYRGAGGAYLHDLLNGWTGAAPVDFQLPAPYNAKWPGLFGSLQHLAANADYENWLFVFGTAISASFPTAQAVNKKWLLDAKKPGEIYNTALIQLGGVGKTAQNYTSRKHYKSGIDFIGWNTGRLHTDTNVLPAEPEAIIPEDVLGVTEGGALFNIPIVNDAAGKAIDFGVEVCLDHARSGGNRANTWGRIRTANQWVKLQLVPSGGMSLVDASIRLEPSSGPTPHSYAFNCDGLGSLAETYGCHTQIWNGANGAAVPPVNKLIEANNGTALAKTKVGKVIDLVMTPTSGSIKDELLWNSGLGNDTWLKGSGSVRVVDPLDL